MGVKKKTQLCLACFLFPGRPIFMGPFRCIEIGPCPCNEIQSHFEQKKTKLEPELNRSHSQPLTVTQAKIRRAPPQTLPLKKVHSNSPAIPFRHVVSFNFIYSKSADEDNLTIRSVSQVSSLLNSHIMYP